MQRLHPFLACFFDLPLKNVLQILNVSHHTLDPIRRSMGMKKWPFVDIVRGKYCQREEIVALRAQMMPGADTEMQQTLCRMAASSEEFWTSSSKRIERTRRRGPLEECIERTRRRGPSEERAADPPPPEPEPEPADVFSAGGEDESFWNDMRDIFALGESAFADEEAPASADERGLFSE